MTATPERRRLSSLVAITTRHHPDDPGLPALRAELAARQLEEHIRDVVSSTPLSAGQRDRLAVLLHADGD